MRLYYHHLRSRDVAGRGVLLLRLGTVMWALYADVWTGASIRRAGDGGVEELGCGGGGGWVRGPAVACAEQGGDERIS